MATVIDLKAKAYDILAKTQELERLLRQINVQIAEAQQKEAGAAKPANIEKIAKEQKPETPA